MARIAGVDLPRDKRVEVGLTYIFGIGRKTSNNIFFRPSEAWLHLLKMFFQANGGSRWRRQKIRSRTHSAGLGYFLKMYLTV